MKSAAEHGHAKAELNLGKMYLTGRGVAADIDKARMWLARASEHGLNEAAALAARLDRRERAAPQRDDKNGWGAAVSIERPIPEPRSFSGAPPVRGEASLILEAAWRGQSRLVAKLIGSGAGTQVTNADGNAPLALAAASGNYETVRVLLDAGANVNAANRVGDTALLLASAGGHTTVVNALIEKGADPNKRNAAGERALTQALRSCSVATTKVLLERGADIGASQ